MRREVVAINFFRYRTPDGDPTCAISPDEKCSFLFARRFGTEEICNGTGCADQDRPLLKRGGGGIGYLEPVKECPLFKNEKTDYL